jgi:hypothetical protein
LVLALGGCGVQENDLTGVDHGESGQTDSAPSTAGDPGVILTTPTALYSYDVDANTASTVAEFEKGDFLIDVALSADGVVYASGLAGIYRVDVETGTGSRMPLIVPACEGLASLPDGRLAAACGSEVLVINTVDWTSTVLLLSEAFVTSGDVTWFPDGKLYWTATSSEVPVLVRLDLDGGDAELVGPTESEPVFGLTQVDGALLGFTAEDGVLDLDPETGAVQSRSDLTGTWSGAASAPTAAQEAR